MDVASVASAPSHSKAHNLFQVFLRLRPPPPTASSSSDQFIDVEEPETTHAPPTHITLNPPNDRRRAIEKFAFTQVFGEDATQLDVFHCTSVAPLVEGVLAPHGGEGTDALLATLGVTGSGKSHTILGSKSQRGLTQLSLDLIFRSIGRNILDCTSDPTVEAAIHASDSSEAAVYSAPAFLDSVYVDPSASTHSSSRAPTPMIVRPPNISSCSPSKNLQPPSHGSFPLTRPLNASKASPTSLLGSPNSSKTVRSVRKEGFQLDSSPLTPGKSVVKTGTAHAFSYGLNDPVAKTTLRQDYTYQSQQKVLTPSTKRKDLSKHFTSNTAASQQKKTDTKRFDDQGDSMGRPPTPSRRLLNRAPVCPQQPDISSLSVACDPGAEYAVVISMYEVYNDRIFDLLTPPIKSMATKEYRRRPLLFKSTEASPDRKVVAGLRKVVCSNLHQALMVLDAGLHERRVAGTGSNSVSSRSHGFFCVEVKKRSKAGRGRPMGAGWTGNALTVVDLAGSERARDAKTAGTTLAEAGKINESLMYLGQCLQMQSDAAGKEKPNLVPFRQCKLTELLFSNSFPSVSSYSSSTSSRRNPQKAVMIVTADPHGDFNATSQILRYSALAREVTVPRIPSITQTILSATNAAPTQPVAAAGPMSSPTLHHRPFSPPGHSSAASNTGGHLDHAVSSPNVQRTFSPPVGSPGCDDHRSTMELAALEIARLSEEGDYLREALQSEQSLRMEVEAHLLSMEDRMLELEQAIREDCTNEFERRLEIEMARWRTNMQLEMERGEEHWDRKIEVFERTMAAEPEPLDDGGGGGGGDEIGGCEDKENVLVEDVGEENDRLRREIEILRRELAAMSPTKRMPLRERGSDATLSGSGSQRARAADSGSPRPSRVKAAGGAPSVGLDGALQRRMESLRVSDSTELPRPTPTIGSPKKIRKLPTKRWDTPIDPDDLP